MHELVGLIAFAFAGSASPGPNNTLLWASGMGFGFRRAAPHVVGTALGIGALAVAMAAGLGVVLGAVPNLVVGLKVVGSIYLLVLASLLLAGGTIGRQDVSRPLTLWEAVAFQFANPKAWIFAIAAVGAFFSVDARPIHEAVLTGALMIVVVGSSSIWAAGGAMLGRIVDDERTRRTLNIVLAVLLVASVALLWI
jgi:threonine/homoserine/homoserine lactone efflux protein